MCSAEKGPCAPPQTYSDPDPVRSRTLKIARENQKRNAPRRIAAAQLRAQQNREARKLAQLMRSPPTEEESINRRIAALRASTTRGQEAAFNEDIARRLEKVKGVRKETKEERNMRRFREQQLRNKAANAKLAEIRRRR